MFQIIKALISKIWCRHYYAWVKTEMIVGKKYAIHRCYMCGKIKLYTYD